MKDPDETLAADATEIASAAPTAGKGPLARAGRSVIRRLTALYRWARQVDPFRNTQLAWRIFVVNLILYVVVVAVTLWLGQSRSTLVEQRVEALTAQATIIAATIAEHAGVPQTQTYDWVHANNILRSLALPTGFRAQIYDRNGRLTGDTRNLHEGEFLVETAPIDRPGPLGGLFFRIQEFYDRYLWATGQKRELYRESLGDSIPDHEEIYKSLDGENLHQLRENSERELIISVYVPVRRVKTVLGVIVFSTIGGDIDAIVDKEFNALFRFYGIALLANAAASLWVGGLIARPIRRLAAGADSHERAGKEPGAPKKAAIPDYSNRSDEIGKLSRSLIRMTNSLYDRIGDIESFAADVAHELKNPLSSMRSAVEYISRADDPKRAKELLGVIKNDIDRMNRLVTDIANASRLDAELVREKRSDIDMRRMLETMVDINQGSADEAGVSLILELPAVPARLTARGLENRLAQVFHNLIDNAISFSSIDSKVTISAHLETLDNVPSLLVEIVDEGPGVPVDNLESIFRRFYSLRPEGETFGLHSGLGLSICRQIVQAHGGRIWAENRSDRSGAKFKVAIPR